MIHVLLIYIKNLVLVSIVLLISFILAKYITILLPNIITPKSRVIIFLIGSGLMLVAAISRLGFEFQTFDGSSPPEILFSLLFWGFSVIGTILLVFDYCVGFFKN